MPPTHQTVRLSRGRHTGPKDGTCVMELASMLAGEPFSDRPACACPVTAALLRAYNDAVDDRRRQTLFGVAAEVVDTAPAPDVLARRVDHLLAWALARTGRGHAWRRFLLRASVRAEDWDTLGRETVRTLGRLDDHRHLQVHALVRELLAIGAPPPAPADAAVRPAPAPPAAPATA
jgi:hypothetical protein